MQQRPDMRNDKLRVLLVDDEPNVLNGLRRSLRPMRDTLDMAFAPSARQALCIMAGGPLDLIISDMRMPGTDGIQLLREVRERFPGVVRFALSGDVSREALLASAGLVHRYLAKPCDPNDLRAALSRVCELSFLITNDELKSTLSQLESLPARPSLHGTLAEALDVPSAAREDIGGIIAADIAMTAKVLQVAGWALFGDNQLFFSAARAVNSLGVDTLRAIASSQGAFTPFEHETFERLALGALWDHSRAVAHLARQIAQSSDAGDDAAEQAYAGGMLHDAGKLIFAATTPVAYAAAPLRAAAGNISLLQAERNIIGATHPEAGAYLLGIWGLADPIVQAVRFHHNPAGATHHGLCAVTAVHIANALIHNGSEPGLDLPYLEQLGISDQIETWQALLSEPVAT